MTNLENLSVEQLVDLFRDLSLQQDDALLDNAISKFNRLFKQMAVVTEELKSRSGDRRDALQALYAHPNPQVRLMAAKKTLAVAPVAARQLLEKLAASKEFPQAGDAGMSLLNLDSGVFKPK